MKTIYVVTRRKFLRETMLGAALLATPGVFAEALQRTPAQTEGPFYPDKLPLDTDNDLIRVNTELTPAVGEVTHLTGRVLDARGEPVRNCLVEIWQCDINGVYLHTASSGSAKYDSHFQGFGRFLTGSSGDYYFRTIKPVPYGAGGMQRTPHIHYALHAPGQEKFTTQCYIKGHPQNEADGVLRGIRDAKARESVLVDFAAMKESRVGELAARFDVILGFTPQA
jgi:protocatechuate 3,4-dioxygenase beta subunit